MKQRDLVELLDEGDELHQRAAALIRQLRKDLAEEIREGQHAAREAFSEGIWSAREEREGW